MVTGNGIKLAKCREAQENSTNKLPVEILCEPTRRERTRPMKLWNALLMSGLLLASLSGCPGDDKPPVDPGKNDPDSPEVEDLGPELSGTPTVTVADWEGIQQQIGTHHGQPVAVLVWTSWNERLEIDMTQFVRLAKVFRDKDVKFLTINGDAPENPPETSQETVKQIADKYHANFPHFVSSTADELIQEEAGIWFPAVLLYGRDGKLRHRFYQQVDIDNPDAPDVPVPLPMKAEVQPAIKTLLAEPAPPASEKPAIKPPAANNSEVSVLIKNWEETQALIAARQGKVVVLDLWSTSCPPCIREFPNLVQLQKDFPKKVACMSMSLDYTGLDPLEEIKPAVLEFLTKKNATFTNILCSVPDDEIYPQLKLSSIPAVYVYSKDGKLAKRFDAESANGEFTYEADIIPLVKKLADAN